MQLQGRQGARARGAMEAFGSGHQVCLTKSMDSYHRRYTLGMVIDIWIYYVDIISCRYSTDFFDGKHQVVVGYSSVFEARTRLISCLHNSLVDLMPLSRESRKGGPSETGTSGTTLTLGLEAALHTISKIRRQSPRTIM